MQIPIIHCFVAPCFTVNFRFQSKFPKPLSLAEKEKLVMIIALSLHPPACETPCLQMANFCLIPYAVWCNCLLLAARSALCLQTLLLQRLW